MEVLFRNALRAACHATQSTWASSGAEESTLLQGGEGLFPAPVRLHWADSSCPLRSQMHVVLHSATCIVGQCHAAGVAVHHTCRSGCELVTQRSLQFAGIRQEVICYKIPGCTIAETWEPYMLSFKQGSLQAQGCCPGMLDPLIASHGLQGQCAAVALSTQLLTFPVAPRWQQHGAQRACIHANAAADRQPLGKLPEHAGMGPRKLPTHFVAHSSGHCDSLPLAPSPSPIGRPEPGSLLPSCLGSMQQHPSSRPARSSSSCKGQSLETCTSLNPNDYTYASLQQLAMPQLCAQFMMCSMLARWLPQPPMQFAAPHQPFQMPCTAANCAPPLHLVPFAPPEVHAPAQHLSKSMAAPVSALPSPRGKRTSDCSRQIAAPAKARKTATAKEVAAAPRPHDANTPLALEPLALKDIRDLFEEHERPQEVRT